MRVAPQVGFSRHILRIRSRTSRATTGRPDLPCRTTTVSGLTMTNVEHQSCQMRDRQTQKRRSGEFNVGRFGADLWSTPIWWRRAKFSSWRSRRERTIERRVTISATRETSIVGWIPARKYNPRRLRSFRIFERHRASIQSPFVGCRFHSVPNKLNDALSAKTAQKTCVLLPHIEDPRHPALAEHSGFIVLVHSTHARLLLVSEHSKEGT